MLEYGTKINNCWHDKHATLSTVISKAAYNKPYILCGGNVTA